MTISQLKFFERVWENFCPQKFSQFPPPPPFSSSRFLFSPFFSFFFLVLFAALAYTFSIPQEQALKWILAYFTLIVFLHPGNGIYFLTLIIPFFLGDEKRPYFYLLDVMTLLTLVSAAFHFSFHREKTPNIPHRGKILLFLAVSLLSIPINAKGLYYHLCGTPVPEIWNSFWSGQENSPVYYLRSLFHLISNVSLYCITLWSFRNENDFQKWLKPFLCMNLLMWIFAYCFYFGNFPENTSYLSTSLIGHYPIEAGKLSLTGFAYNAGYLGEYWILAFPLIAVLLYSFKSHLFFSATAALTLILGLAAIPFLYQRGTVIALSGQVLFFCAFWIWQSKNRLQTLKWASLFCLLYIFLYFFIDYFFLHSAGIIRLKNMFSHPSLRDKIWQVSLTMFTHHPLLGIGLGKFHYFFPEYCKLAEIPWEGHIRYVRTTAHNVYFHMLAEQGILGLSAFLFMLAAIFKTSITQFKKLEEAWKPHALGLLIALFGWACYGLTQHVFYIRSIQIFFWIVLGFLGMFYRPTLKSLSKETVLWRVLACAMVWIVLCVYRLTTITA